VLCGWHLSLIRAAMRGWWLFAGRETFFYDFARQLSHPAPLFSGHSPDLSAAAV